MWHLLNFDAKPDFTEEDSGLLGEAKKVNLS